MSNPQTDKIWDISTRHVTKKDGELMNPDTIPQCLCEIFQFGQISEGACGAIFWVTQDCTEDDRERSLMLLELTDKGFSRDFVEIMNKASKAGVRYVRFDCDADGVEGWPEHDW